MPKIAISSGHGLFVRGAEGLIDEVNEAREVVDRVAQLTGAPSFHDNTSTTQDENLKTIVTWHNAQERDLDVSVHFNCYQSTDRPMGTEVLYLTAQDVAVRMSDAIAKSGLIDRGAKYRDDLYFLNNTDKPAILIEVCFVDSVADVEIYDEHFAAICRLIAQSLKGREEQMPLVSFSGPCSWFGGPDDQGVAPDEGLAFLYDASDAPHLFLDSQPEGTTGLARRLDPDVFYVACRWDYEVTPKDMLADPGLRAVVIANGRAHLASPADWGPHEQTGRAADISPGLMDALGIETDDEVKVIYPV